MSYHPFHESARRDMDVAEDGSVSLKDGGGSAAALAKRIEGRDLLRPLSANLVLAACTPLPARLLLVYIAQTELDNERSIEAGLSVNGIVGMVAGSMAAMLILWLFPAAAPLAAIVCAAFSVWAPLRGWLEDKRRPGQVWERSEWINFKDRTWNYRKHYPDASLPDERSVLPLDSLVLCCYWHYWDGGDHECVLALCRREELESTDDDNPFCLSRIHSPADEARGIELGNRLACLWGIGCFYRTQDESSQLNKVAQ